jgi:hypothetical protein
MQEWDVILKYAPATEGTKIQWLFKSGSRKANRIIYGSNAGEVHINILDAKLRSDQDAWLFIFNFGFKFAN